jgi:hypothetical protein
LIVSAMATTSAPSQDAMLVFPHMENKKTLSKHQAVSLR